MIVTMVFFFLVLPRGTILNYEAISTLYDEEKIAKMFESDGATSIRNFVALSLCEPDMNIPDKEVQVTTELVGESSEFFVHEGIV